jgi:hypothetical protein
MRRNHLTDLQLECLGCALEDTSNAAAQELRAGTGAAGVDGVVAALFVATADERLLFVQNVRQALDLQRTKCLAEATAAICPAARRAACAC